MSDAVMHAQLHTIPVTWHPNITINNNNANNDNGDDVNAKCNIIMRFEFFNLYFLFYWLISSEEFNLL